MVGYIIGKHEKKISRQLMLPRAAPDSHPRNSEIPTMAKDLHHKVPVWGASLPEARYLRKIKMKISRRYWCGRKAVTEMLFDRPHPGKLPPVLYLSPSHLVHVRYLITTTSKGRRCLLQSQL